ncbi:nucleus export protein [Babesia ovis]|uniref:Nucleus export protein n=1 Tax=Babesia ovis TaxID=5869 RepID=A0A9W5WVR1_BABOV|nr:nucleus export protein [Babesia ovis]
MEFKLYENGRADVGDTLADLSALSLASKGVTRESSDKKYRSKYRNSSNGQRDVDPSDDDILFVGTNIKVKVDREEDMLGDYNMAGDSTDSCYVETHENRNTSNANQYEDFDMKYRHSGPSAVPNTVDDKTTNEEENADVTKISHQSPEKPQTGFLLNFFRGKGARATLKSIVKGKAVYNKVIDLDADCETPCEFEDVNDAIEHIALGKAAVCKAPSVTASVSNQSTGSSRRRRDHYNEYHHRHDYHPRRYYPAHSIIGLGRIDPNQMGHFNFYRGAQNNKGNLDEKNIMTPEVFNGWVRAFFNVAVTSVILYIGFVFILAIGRDIGNGLEKRRQMVKAEAMLCQELYKKNKCRTVNVPALEQQCRDWEACMYRDAILYDDASFLSAEVLGGVINKFVSQLDARTVGIVLVTFLALFVGSNCALSMSATARPSSPGWFRRWFCRSRQPADGSDLLQNGGLVSQQQMLQAMQNPYLQPNYVVMGSYPYVNGGCYTGPYQSSSISYYNDDQDGSANWGSKAGRISAWKRRFTSPWVDQE